MGNVGWSELLVIGIVSLIVVGPKDLPVMFNTLGRFVAKLRSLGREFNRAMDDAVRDAGVKDMANDIRNATSPKTLGLDKMQEAAKKFEAWDPMKPITKPKAAPAPKGPATAALAAEQEARRAKLAEEAAAKAALRASEAPLTEDAPLVDVPPPAPAAAAAPKAPKAPAKPRSRARAKPTEPKA